jgi:hypothetical protein
MSDEVCRFLPDGVEVEVFEISQHTNPKLLKSALQTAIDNADSKHDVILLGYGLCSNAVVGLKTQHARLVIPKIHDCIGIFLGSHRAYLEEMAIEPTFFLTQGYINGYRRDQSGPLSEFARVERRFGTEKAEKIVGTMMRAYKRLVYIRTPGSLEIASDRSYAREMADKFGMCYQELDSTSELLERMVKHDWKDDIIVVEPGQEITLEHFIN